MEGPFSKLGYSVLGCNCGSSHHVLSLLCVCLLDWFSFTVFLGFTIGGVVVYCHHSSLVLKNYSCVSCLWFLADTVVGMFLSKCEVTCCGVSCYCAVSKVVSIVTVRSRTITTVRSTIIISLSLLGLGPDVVILLFV